QYSEYAQNQIFDQDPPEGRKAKVGSTITVKVSMGARKVEIQDFTNRTQSAAEQQLKREGFNVNSTFSESEDIPKGNVIRTQPPAHDMASVGSTVTLVVSLGPKNTPVYVENYVGLPQEEAIRLCDEQGLIATFESKDSEEEAGTVIAQDKARGTLANKGDTIKLTISTGQIPEVSYSVNVDLPNNISGIFKIKYYVDGVIDQTASTEVRDVSLSGSKRLRYDVKGKPGETKYLGINVESQVTGKEGTFVEIEITFNETTGVPKQIGQANSSIFAELLNGEPQTSSSSSSSSSSTSATPGYSEPEESTSSSDSSNSSDSSDTSDTSDNNSSN
ncbi:MAG: PASTA domain-containing protein, partial [Ruminococcus sp.]|nr:PASTA domain-containing protein [Ruminococcus sp.]